MLQIPCPWCGPRPEMEFHCGGEAGLARPKSPENCDDAHWAAFLFQRRNPRGPHAELWLHRHGCRRWFELMRDTRDDTILAASPLGSAETPRSETPAR